jgi:hypothetical protein
MSDFKIISGIKIFITFSMYVHHDVIYGWLYLPTRNTIIPVQRKLVRHNMFLTLIHFMAKHVFLNYIYLMVRHVFLTSIFVESGVKHHEHILLKNKDTMALE